MHRDPLSAEAATSEQPHAIGQRFDGRDGLTDQQRRKHIVDDGRQDRRVRAPVAVTRLAVPRDTLIGVALPKAGVTTNMITDTRPAIHPGAAG